MVSPMGIMRIPIHFTIFLLIITTSEIYTQKNEEYSRNEVIGEPVVSCAADAIYVKFRTKTTFRGHVDVKYTPDKTCFQSLVTNNQIEVLIPHEQCMVPRRRSLHPTGVILEAALSISFHPEFTTIDDRVFNLQCFHQKKTNESQAGLSIGSPNPPPQDTQGPTCSYQVLSNLGGLPVGRLALGQNVYHHWHCENVYESCIIIENCELIGGEEKHIVIDGEGCSKHQNIMPQPEYHNKTSAGVIVKVFGVSHTPIVYFSCQVRLHPQLPSGECPAPKCSDPSRKKREHSNLPSIDVRSQNLEISQLVNATVSDPIMTSSCTSELKEDLPSYSTEIILDDPEKICADFRTVLIASVIMTVGCIVITSIIVILVVRRQKYEIASMS